MENHLRFLSASLEEALVKAERCIALNSQDGSSRDPRFSRRAASSHFISAKIPEQVYYTRGNLLSKQRSGYVTISGKQRSQGTIAARELGNNNNNIGHDLYLETCPAASLRHKKPNISDHESGGIRISRPAREILSASPEYDDTVASEETDEFKHEYWSGDLGYSRSSSEISGMNDDGSYQAIVEYSDSCCSECVVDETIYPESQASESEGYLSPRSEYSSYPSASINAPSEISSRIYSDCTSQTIPLCRGTRMPAANTIRSKPNPGKSDTTLHCFPTTIVERLPTLNLNQRLINRSLQSKNPDEKISASRRNRDSMLSRSNVSRGIIVDYTSNKRIRCDTVKRFQQYQKAWASDRFLTRQELLLPSKIYSE